MFLIEFFDYSENADYNHTILNVALGATYFILIIDEKLSLRTSLIRILQM